MNAYDIERAAALLTIRKRALENREALSDYNVYGVELRRGKVADPIRIASGCSSGTGSISSICWSDDLQDAVTTAFKKIFDDRIKKAEDDIRALGVEL